MTIAAGHVERCGPILVGLIDAGPAREQQPRAQHVTVGARAVKRRAAKLILPGNLSTGLDQLLHLCRIALGRGHPQLWHVVVLILLDGRLARDAGHDVGARGRASRPARRRRTPRGGT